MLEGERLKKIKVKAKVENFDICASFIEEQMEAAGFESKAIIKMITACEEIIVNVMNYAYADGEGDLEISFSDGEGFIKIIFIDNGKQFNPLDKPDADISLSADEREIGGLGIHMVRRLVDDVNYEYSNNQNILTLMKSL